MCWLCPVRHEKRPKVWLVYFIEVPNKLNELGRLFPVFTVAHEGPQEDLYARLPNAPDGRSARDAWYPRVLEDAPRVPLHELDAQARAWLEAHPHLVEKERA